MALGTLSWGEQVDEYVAQDQLKTFSDAGGTLIDTSPVHGAGGCESMVASVLTTLGARDRIVLAARAGASLHRGRMRVDVSRRGLLTQLDATLATLGVNHLDLWQLERWDPSIPIEETMSALAHAVQSGRVRYVGVSNLKGWQMALAHAHFDRLNTGTPLVGTQNEYSLLQRSIESEVLPAATQLSMGVLACSPLGRGVLTGKYRRGVPSDSRAAHPEWEHYVAGYLTTEAARVVEAMSRAADGLGFTAAQVALAWLLKRPQVATVVVGARTVEQLTESLAVADVDLPNPIVAALDDVSEEA